MKKVLSYLCIALICFQGLWPSISLAQITNPNLIVRDRTGVNAFPVVKLRAGTSFIPIDTFQNIGSSKFKVSYRDAICTQGVASKSNFKRVGPSDMILPASFEGVLLSHNSSIIAPKIKKFSCFYTYTGHLISSRGAPLLPGYLDKQELPYEVTRCGDGTVDPEEQCDNTNRSKCTADCKTVDTPQYQRILSGYTTCSAACGIGSQTGQYICVVSGTNIVTGDNFCTAQKPTSSQSCKIKDCPNPVCTNPGNIYTGNAKICGANPISTMMPYTLGNTCASTNNVCDYKCDPGYSMTFCSSYNCDGRSEIGYKYYCKKDTVPLCNPDITSKTYYGGTSIPDEIPYLGCSGGSYSTSLFAADYNQIIWSCSVGGTSVSCKANHPYCGDGEWYSSETCETIGGVTKFKDSNQTTGNYNCNSCKATPIPPQCGSANGSGTSTKPSSNLCNPGSASTVSDGTQWTWTCSNNNGTTPVSCSAPKPPVICTDPNANNNGGTLPCTYGGRLTLGDRVWYDTDRDGIQGSNELGVKDVKVELLMCDGSQILQTTTTDTNGNYIFTGLNVGNYTVRFILPNGYTWTTQTNNTASGSDVNSAGTTDCIYLTTDRRDIDAGVVISTPTPGAPDIRVLKYVNPYEMMKNGVATYRINVTNVGPVDVSSFTVYDDLDSRLAYIPDSCKVSNSVLSNNCTYSSPRLSWIIKGLKAGEAVDLTFQARVLVDGPVTIPNVATGVGVTGETNLTNNQSGVNIIVNPVSCNDLSVTPTTVTGGQTISYSCTGVGAATGHLEVLSGDQLISHISGLQGSLSIATGGVYGLRCMVGGTTDYKLELYTNNNNSTCQYRTNPADSKQSCATPGLTVTPYSIVYSLSDIVGALQPMEYCTSSQISAWACATVPNGQSLFIKNTTTCNKTVLVTTSTPPTSGNLSLGDKVWHDVNNNGVQDAGELGISGVVLELYRYTSTGECGSKSGGVKVSTTTTDMSGKYMFTGLASGIYRVYMTAMPVGYDTITIAGTGTDRGVDSNLMSDRYTDCIELTSDRLDIDMGVYKSSGGGGGGGCSPSTEICNSRDDDCDGFVDEGCGGGGGGGGSYYPTPFNNCGNKVVEIGEYCDEGTVGGLIPAGRNYAGRTCTSSCTLVDNIPGTTGYLPPKCDYIDPPSIQMGETLPIRWNMDKSSSTAKIKSICTNAGDVIESTMNCSFEIENALGETKDSFIKPCNTKDSYNGVLSSFISTTANSHGRTSRLASFGDIYGEYKISLTNISYQECVASGSTFKLISKDTKTGPITGQRICEYNFAVTRPYSISKGLGVATTPYDLSNFYGFASTTTFTDLMKIDYVGLKKASNSSTSLDANLKAKVTTMITNYDKKAVKKVGSLRKVPNANIYIADGDFTYSDTTKLPGATIISKGNITVKGNVSSTVMLVANGDIRFESTNCNDNQTVNGVYIALGSLTSPRYFNGDNRVNTTRCDKGGLIVKGILIGNDSNLVNNRRSNLNNWFNTKGGNVTKEKQEYIVNGASVLIDSSNTAIYNKSIPGFASISSSIRK